MDENIKVYVKLDQNGCIISINSSIFIGDATGYIQIDEGQGDKYAHAQGQYLDKGLMDMQGHYNYKLVDGKVVELTDEEKEKLFPPQTAPQEPTLEEKLAATQKELDETQSKLVETRTSLENVSGDFQKFMDYALSKLPN